MNSSTPPFHHKIILETISNGVKIQIFSQTQHLVHFVHLYASTALSYIDKCFLPDLLKSDTGTMGPCNKMPELCNMQLPPNHSLFI